MAGVNSDSVVYDLGCGDGAIVVAAARNYGAKKVVGIEQSKRLCSIALAKTRGLRNASIIQANYDDVNLSEASVVSLYQSASENARLKAKFVRELSEGTTIVSHDYGIPGWRPTQLRNFRDHRRGYRVVVYVMGSHSPASRGRDERGRSRETSFCPVERKSHGADLHAWKDSNQKAAAAKMTST